MELNTNNNYEQESMDYERRPNPNDALFGGMSVDEPYQIRSTYVAAPAKKSSSPIIAIAIVLIAALIIGGVVYNLKKEEKEARRFDGTYVLTMMKVNGMELDMEKFTQMTGATFSGRIEIDGKEGYIELDVSGAGVDNSANGECDVELEGNTVKLVGPGGTLYFEHGSDEDGEYISFEDSGNYLYFYKE